VTDWRLAAFATVVVIVLAGPASAEPDAATFPRIEPLNRGRGEAVIANADVLADEVGRFVQHPGNAHDEAILDDVRGVMGSPAEWRWYNRDHGLMVAVPVRDRLAYVTRRNAESLLATAIRRTVSTQGLGSPPVQVVFIEPERPCHVPRLPSGDFMMAADSGLVDNFEGLAGASTAGDCGCR